MEDLVATGLKAAGKPGVVYADVRVVTPQRYEHLAVRNGEASALTSTHRGGVGVRVRTRTAWGFATSPQLTKSAVRESAAYAIRVAHAAGRTSDAALEVTEEKGPHN